MAKEPQYQQLNKWYVLLFLPAPAWGILHLMTHWGHRCWLQPSWKPEAAPMSLCLSLMETGNGMCPLSCGTLQLYHYSGPQGRRSH